jgi:UDP-N-acetylglucosamine:LPS N-acetylglucosamine transferase
MNKRIIIAGGGTGGHIFPAIAIANALKSIDKKIEILFVGAKGKMEMEKVPQHKGIGYRRVQPELFDKKYRVAIQTCKKFLAGSSHFPGIQTGCSNWSRWLFKFSCIANGAG